ncbi:hypothetical protein [Streptomyces flavalbus]|uniref:Uncharacterized protein n=1 Tax=Streptomyces flavalbus TaxID=2665155 RepID=A0ABW2W2G7_9ACTN
MYGPHADGHGDSGSRGVAEGRRLLMLDEPLCQRSWNADRFFPMLPGTAELTRVLPPDEVQTWFTHTCWTS